MKNKFNIIVEGDADVKFFKDYCRHLFGEDFKVDGIFKSGGWTNIVNIKSRLESMTDHGGVNLIIFDADMDADKRRYDILKIRENNGLSFDLFLLPDNKSTGALEDLLENIISPNNQPILDCWNDYETELKQVNIPGRNRPLTTPAKKSKIYCYLETLHGTSETEKKKIKDANRDFTNTEHWNLDAEYLKPLKEFLEKNLKED